MHGLHRDGEEAIGRHVQCKQEAQNSDVTPVDAARLIAMRRGPAEIRHHALRLNRLTTHQI